MMYQLPVPHVLTYRSDRVMHASLPKGFTFLTLEMFEPCVGEEFEVQSQPVHVKIRLDQLQKLAHGPGFLTRAPFTLLWSTVPAVNILLGNYRLRNGKWGPHEVYIEPMLAMSERRVYQSVFF
jgi:hypothetical protein